MGTKFSKMANFENKFNNRKALIRAFYARKLMFKSRKS